MKWVTSIGGAVATADRIFTVCITDDMAYMNIYTRRPENVHDWACIAEPQPLTCTVMPVSAVMRAAMASSVGRSTCRRFTSGVGRSMV